MYSDILLRTKDRHKTLNFDIDLHIAIYIHTILHNIFDFSLDRFHNLIIIKNSDTKNKRYDIQRFKYWIQYTFYNELLSELPIYNNTINIEINELRQRVNGISAMKHKLIKTDKDALLKLIADELKLKKQLKAAENSIQHKNNVISNCINFILRHLNTDEVIIELFKNLKTVIYNLQEEHLPAI